MLNILRLICVNQVVVLLDPGCVGISVSGVPVLGGDELLSRLRAEGILAAARKAVYEDPT